MACLNSTQLLRYLNGSLSAAELPAIDVHLDNCPSCRVLVTGLLSERMAPACQSSLAAQDSISSVCDASTSGMVHAEVGRRYVLRSLLGEGGMGQVFAAHDRLTQKSVALKRVSRRRVPARQLGLKALAQEFRILAGLRHPHIISVLDYGFDAERQPYFTMELLPEVTTLLTHAEAVSMTARLELLTQLLRALTYLHRRKILHRDLKPSTVATERDQTSNDPQPRQVLANH